MKRTVYYIKGDGIGPEIFDVAIPVLNAAVAAAYDDGRSLDWQEVPAGESSYQATGEYLPQSTLDTLAGADLAIKGPMTTPVGKGFRSLNVALRQTLDLYACIRPVRYFQGIHSPLKHPEKVDMVVFRENTEDVYAGIEYQAHSPETDRLIAFLRDELGADVALGSAVGIKPMSEKGCKRLVRKAVQYALDRGRKSVTLVHKGNIMKFTEGAFRAWGYELAAEEFGQATVPWDKAGDDPSRLVIKDCIADAMFQEVLIRPEQHDVIATSNLNGDYLSDALAAQVGGLGLAPGVNMSDSLAIFEATHGTAPAIAGKDMANPGSVILSGAMMLEHAGWVEAARRIHDAMDTAISDRRVTVDLATQIPDSTTVGCREFGDILMSHL